ncbi:MAG: hypothetical protein AAGI48_04030 [Verrucomicrobiota bacterium]
MATKKATRKTASKGSNYRRFRDGLMGKRETVPLAMTARRAFAYQGELGNIPEGVKFDDWRRDQVHEVTGNHGLTKCHHDDYKPLMGHFLTLAGEDASAFEEFMRTGPASAAKDDTHELRRQLAHDIIQRLTDHLYIADHTLDEILQDFKAQWEKESPDTPYPGPEPRYWSRLRLRKAHIAEHPDKAIREGYLVHLVRQKTGRPNLTLGDDLKTGLADRCTVEQLLQIRDTLSNRIAAREGAEDRGRNSKQRKS